MARRGGRPGPAALAALVAAVTLLAGCSDSGADARTGAQGSSADPAQVDTVETPELGACRRLTPDDVALASNATETVDCSRPHTAQTYAVGEMPAELDTAGYDDPDVGAAAYELCSAKLRTFLGADESLSLRTVLSWAWFRPSAQAWESGARWYRCDVVGGGEQSAELVDLPETAEGLLQGRPDDRWLVCVAGPSVDGAPRIPCSQDHDWRAVTTIKLGEPADDYPGDRVSEVRTRDFCNRSVAAWLNYPVEFDYGYTWFHRAEWDAGNRRSICWARTSE